MSENEQLRQAGFQLCEMDGECDFCEKEVKQGDYFWLRTSYEYVEGDYYCRKCAVKRLDDDDAPPPDAIAAYLTEQGVDLKAIAAMNISDNDHAIRIVMINGGEEFTYDGTWLRAIGRLKAEAVQPESITHCICKLLPPESAKPIIGIEQFTCRTHKGRGVFALANHNAPTCCGNCGEESAATDNEMARWAEANGWVRGEGVK